MGQDLIPFSSLQEDPNENYLPQKPEDQLRREYKIRQELVEQGVLKEIADSVIGYRPDQVPFIYKDVPSEVLHHRVRDDWTEGHELLPGKSSLWIGTTDAIWNMYNENGLRDQIPEVIVQWRGNQYTESEQQKAGVKIERQEVKQLPDGSFVLITYRNVSNMGAFDGEIANISVYIPEGTFNPSERSDSKSYRIYNARRKTAPNMQGVPGGALRKLDTDNYEWTLDLSGSSNISGTTILNGYEEIVRFNLAEVQPVKQDFDNARRFTPLPSVEETKLLPATEEAEFEMVIREESAIEYDRIMALMPETMDFMIELAPLVLNRLQAGSYIRDAVQMKVDGILRHSEKIWVLNRRLSEIPREQRFGLARMISVALRDGQLLEWVKTLEITNTPGIVNDIALKNARYLLMWFKTSNDPSYDFEGEISRAKKIAKEMKVGEKVTAENSYIFQHAYDGFASTIVERFIEFIVQQYLGSYLS
jgi:hypothetical protein